MEGRPEPLVIAGADGWGEGQPTGEGIRFLGFVPERDLPALYAAATVFAYPSEREGFGLPVAEAMAQGTPVVTSRGTSTEEVASGAAVLVDPFDVDGIAVGIGEAMDRADELAVAGRARAGELSWAATAARTLDVYREVVS
jgi:glycosyltransferase involved in cell wall biosynthesis